MVVHRSRPAVSSNPRDAPSTNAASTSPAHYWLSPKWGARLLSLRLHNEDAALAPAPVDHVSSQKRWYMESARNAAARCCAAAELRSVHRPLQGCQVADHPSQFGARSWRMPNRKTQARSSAGCLCAHFNQRNACYRSSLSVAGSVQPLASSAAVNGESCVVAQAAVRWACTATRCPTVGATCSTTKAARPTRSWSVARSSRVCARKSRLGALQRIATRS